MPRGTKSPRQCTMSDKVSRINLFRVRNIRGWWPFVSIEENTNTIVVSIHIKQSDCIISIFKMI